MNDCRQDHGINEHCCNKLMSQSCNKFNTEKIGPVWLSGWEHVIVITAKDMGYR